MKRIEELVEGLKSTVEEMKVKEQKAIIKSKQASNAMEGIGGIVIRAFSLDFTVSRFFNELCLIDEYVEPEEMEGKSNGSKFLARESFKCSKELSKKFSDVVKSLSSEYVGLFDLDYMEDMGGGRSGWTREDVLVIANTQGLWELCLYLNKELPEFGKMAKKIGGDAFCKELCKGAYNEDLLHYDKLIPLYFGWAYAKEIDKARIWEELLGGNGFSIVDNVRIESAAKGGSEVEIMRKSLFGLYRFFDYAN